MGSGSGGDRGGLGGGQQQTDHNRQKTHSKNFNRHSPDEQPGLQIVGPLRGYEEHAALVARARTR